MPSSTPDISVTDIGSGEFVLLAEYMDLDFQVRGEDNKLVSTSGDLYDENTCFFVLIKNLVTEKQLKDDKCVVSFNAQIKV